LVLLVGNAADQAEFGGLGLGQYYRLVAVPDGETAVAEALELNADMILLGQGMGASGRRALGERQPIRNGGGEVPCLPVVDAGWSAADEAEAWADVLRRPLIPQVVRRRLANLLELRSLRGGAGGVDREAQLETAFKEFCEREWARSVRAGSFLSLLVLGLEREGEGPAGGASAAAQQALVRGCGVVIQRRTDYVARLPGNRVACLLPETDLDGALAVACRVRQALELVAIEDPALGIPGWQRLRIGVASILPHQGNSLTMLRQAAEGLCQQGGEGGPIRGDYVI
jgi:hypothetical protein